MINLINNFLPHVETSGWMGQISHSLGISGDPQGFFLYLLIMVGIFVVISILVYNWLEERRFNKQVESNFSTIEEDALLNDKQQQFFDKFASTTGVLNDQPPEGTFIDENGEALEDDRSIEDVYAELLETMSKRNRKEKVEPTGVTIDYQQVEMTSEPVMEIPSDVVLSTNDEMPSLYIPETPEVSEAELVETFSTPSPSNDEPKLDLTFDEIELSSSTVESVQATTEMTDAVKTDAKAADLASITETQKPTTTEENDIKAIINRAFKEKYNPNYKAELEAQKTQIAQASVEETAEKTQNEETKDAVQAAADEFNETPDLAVEEPAIESVDEEIPALTEVVDEEPLMTTETVEVDVFPELTFPEDEPVISDFEKSDFSATTEEIDATVAAVESDVENLKGFDTDVETAVAFSEPESSAPEPPILEDVPPHSAAIHAPEQTYQQLLNQDSMPEPQDQDDGMPFLISEPSHASSQAAAFENVPTPQEEPSDTGAEEEEQLNQNQETPEPVAPVKSSVFSHALPALLNQHIDFIGTIEASKGSNAAFILESFATFHQQFEFPVYVFMQCEQSQWLLLNDVTEPEISQYLQQNQPVHITASIQMADRTGPISRNTIQRFQQSLSEIAVTMGATAEWVDPTDPIDRAAALDAFCIEVDKTMFFHLANTKMPFTGIKLKGLVETQGMVLESDGYYKYYDLNTESGIKRPVPDFVLFNRDNHKFTEEMLRSSVIKAVTMQLDIPLVPSSASALDRMVVIAQSLESSLNAQLVDDKNRQITDVHLARIRDQIKSIHAAMQLRGITPGSSHAQRLFS